MVKFPSIYIDTNICRDCIKRRSLDSIKLLTSITDKNWKCVTSIFTFMELIDIEKDDLFAHKKIRHGWEINKIWREKHNKELTTDEMEEVWDQIRGFRQTFRDIKIETLDEDGWIMALRLSAKSNLSAVDIIHLSVAWQSKCDVVVTSDQHFIVHGNNFLSANKVSNKMKICNVSKVQETLRGLGYKRIRL